MIELAIGLGGDTAERRIRSAQHYLAAGDSPRAVSILEATIETMEPGPTRAEALSQMGFAHIYKDSLIEAGNCFERALADVGDNQAMRVETLTALAYAIVSTGRTDEARLVMDDAVSQAERLGHPGLLSQALGGSVVARCLQGEGYDETRMRRALELEDRETDPPMVFRPRWHYVFLLSWTGQLDQARREITAVRLRCAERGEEYELAVMSIWYMQIEIWRSDFPAAAAVAEDGCERARLLGGDDTVDLLRINRCVAAAYAGRVEQAREDGVASIAAWQRNGGLAVMAWGLMYLGFLEVSLGNYEAALATLEPLIFVQSATPDATEIYLAWFVPDAVEALIHLGRLDEAEPLIERLQRNGARLDRPWNLAMGARGRAMLLAALGDLESARAAVQHAMTQHDRLAMPFERARTQLLVGQLQRRQRQKDSAAATFGEALKAFEELGTPLWAQRARAELARVNVAASGSELTPSEQRVAELAASGMTNRDVAAAMFISPKTVEANLSRIYHKLDIRSRAELGRRIVGRADRETPDSAGPSRP